jgi:hypothetical protein
MFGAPECGRTTEEAAFRAWNKAAGAVRRRGGSRKMSDEPTPELTEGEETSSEIAIDYLKANLFRVIHMDGAWGGITPGRKIHMALYSERPTIPQRMVFEVTSDRRLGGEKPERRVSREGRIVRELEVAAIMDLATAKSLCEWLRDRIDLLEQLEAQEAAQQEGDEA